MQQSDGVAGGCGVEQDVVEPSDAALGVGEQFGELVERGDLGGARPGQLFGDGGHFGLGQQTAHRSDDAFPVGLRGLVGVDFQRG